MAETRFMYNLTIEIVDPIINGHYEKENFCNINYPIRNIFYLNRGDGLLTPILENLGLRGCEAPIYGQHFLEDHIKYNLYIRILQYATVKFLQRHISEPSEQLTFLIGETPDGSIGDLQEGCWIGQSQAIKFNISTHQIGLDFQILNYSVEKSFR